MQPAYPESDSPIGLSARTAHALDNISSELTLFKKQTIHAMANAANEMKMGEDKGQNTNAGINDIKHHIEVLEQTKTLLHAIDILTGRNAAASTCKEEWEKNPHYYADIIDRVIDYKKTCSVFSPEKGVYYHDTHMPVPTKSTGYQGMLDDLRMLIADTISNGVMKELKEKLQESRTRKALKPQPEAWGKKLLDQNAHRKGKNGGPTPPAH